MKLPGRRHLVHTILLVTILGAAVTTPLVAASPGEAKLTLLNSTPFSIDLEWIAPDLQVSSNPQGKVEISAPGLAQVSQPGELRLPFDAYLLALPTDAQVDFKINSITFTSQMAEDNQLQPYSIVVNPRPEGVLSDEQDTPVGGSWAEVETAPGLTKTTNSPVLLEEVGTFRGVRLARLIFYPVLVDDHGMRFVRNVQAEITWDYPVKKVASKIEDPLIRQLKQQVINPWMVIADAPTKAEPEALSSSFEAEVYLEIDRTGLFRVDYTDLQPYGFSGVDPVSLRLFRGDQEVAFRWEGDGDARFEAGESLLFYGERRFSRWTTVDVYHLISDPISPGARMLQGSADPAGLATGVSFVEALNEENLIYTPDCFCRALPGRDGDHWAWKQLRQPDLNQVTLPFYAPAVNSTIPAVLNVWMISYTENKNTNPDHQVDITLNGVPVGDLIWDGKQAITATLSIPANILVSGQNDLTLSLPGAANGFPGEIWLDAFRVHYARGTALAGQEVAFQAESGSTRAYTLGLVSNAPYIALDITDPLHPVYLNGFTASAGQLALAGVPNHFYWLAGGAAVEKPKRIRAAINLWRFQPGGTPAGASYLVITHAEFASALQPLVDLRLAQGHTVAVADVSGIYDAWGDGRMDPQAIRSFLSAAYASWQPPPTYVLLVGDGSYDPRQNLSTQSTFIPPFLADADPWAGETAADNRYVAVSGADAFPDMLLGRLPVNSLTQTQAVVAKIVAYETKPYPGPWNANTVLVADDQDNAGNFPESNDLSGGYITSPFIARYLTCPNQTKYSPGLDDCPAAIAQKIHADLLNLWNSGVLLIQFTGHSSWQQWAAERYFHLDDLLSLQNIRRLPVVVAMTCFTGAFQRPEPTLDESLILMPGSGAVATWGSTGLGISTGHDSLSQGFFQATFQAGVDTLGQAALAGKLNLFTRGNNLDLLDTFNILGDPALRFNRQIQPWAAQLFLPQVSR